MKTLIPEPIKAFVLQFANLYYEYKVEAENLKKTKYSIYSSLDYYKKTGYILLSYNDKPGDILPPLTLKEIKDTPDILAGLHPIDVNSINDLYYLSQDKISKLILNENTIQVLNKNGDLFEYDINQEFQHENLISQRVAFLIGYIQAENIMKDAYVIKDKYKIIKDNITTLSVLNLETKEEEFKKPLDILFSDEYKNFSKEDIKKIAYICGQMTTI